MIEIQEILVYITVFLAVAYLVNKYFYKPKKTAKSCGKDKCGCH